jgi:IS5 family transposase
MLADKGYDGEDVRSSLLMHGILPVIPPKANRKEPIKDRNRIERMFNRFE